MCTLVLEDYGFLSVIWLLETLSSCQNLGIALVFKNSLFESRIGVYSAG